MKLRFVPATAVILILTLGCAMPASAVRTISPEEVDKAFPQTAPPHPRLLITNKDLAEIKARIQSRPAYKAFAQALLQKADGFLKMPTLERKKVGRRLLGVSRRGLDRVVALSMAYRLTGKRVYLERAEKEMLAVSAFSDFNPSHFLDVAEMGSALAIGYDWLYHDLSPASRATIRKAILEKAIQPSFRGRQWWIKRDNNWNQVCHGGMTLAALAIMEDQPELARQVVHRAVNGIQHVMAAYEPDGAYPEGPGYWVYGTGYNCVFLTTLTSVLQTDFGLSDMPGFSRGAEYYLHVTGPIGLVFNYPDSGLSSGFIPAVFWFARRYDDPSIAWTQHQIWRQAVEEDKASTLVHHRYAPLVLKWANGGPQKPKALSWMGRGHNPVALFRTSWTDPNALFLGIKGGYPAVNHGHMDVGSFVIDAAGLRWAADLGPESYHKIESLGISLWGASQNADRWKIFRYNNSSHNTLVVNGQHQRVNGHAPIIRYSGEKKFPHVVFDLSKTYEGQLASAQRGAALLPTGQIIMQDDLTATDQKTSVRWAMVTPAQVKPGPDSTASLVQSGKTMQLKVVGDIQPTWTTYSTEPKADFDAPNPGTRMVGFEFTLEPGQTTRYQVQFAPPGTRFPTNQTLRPLTDWSAPLPESK